MNIRIWDIWGSPVGLCKIMQECLGKGDWRGTKRRIDQKGHKRGLPHVNCCHSARLSDESCTWALQSVLSYY